MTRDGRRRITDEMFASIPALIAEGKTIVEIAVQFGVTTATLQVYSSQRKISLRLLNGRRPRQQRKPVVHEAVQQLVSLRLAAKARGKSELGLVNEMIEIIVKNNLYDAILGKVGEDATGTKRHPGLSTGANPALILACSPLGT
jgi:hypothetical protein